MKSQIARKRWISVAGAFLLASGKLFAASSITALDFKYATPQSVLEIKTDGAVTYEKTVSEADQQVIIDLKNTRVPEKFKRQTDASQFRSNVALISAYEKGEDARIVLQLKAAGDVAVVEKDGAIVASIDNKTDGTAVAKTDVTASTSDSTALSAEAAAAEKAEQGGSSSTSADNSTESKASDVAQALADPDGLESFMESQDSKKYVGSKISIQMMNADLQDIFRIIANASEFNIILAESVRGKMSLDLTDVPWDQVLDIVLKANRLAAEKVANILRILPMEDLQREKVAETQAKKAVEVAEPLVSKIFPISYAAPQDLQRILGSYLSRDTTSGTARGAIDIDIRTNSLVVRETPSTIEKFKKLIKELDTQTPQILIEAKFVEVRENFSRDFTGQIMATSRETLGGLFDFHPGNNNYGAIFGTGSTIGSSTSALALSNASSGMSFGFAPKAGLLPGMPNLAALINISESNSMAKTISSPRIVTQNRRTASITQGITVTFPTTAGANSTGGFQTLNTSMSLSVEPQVTNEGSINLRISFSESKPQTGLPGATFTTSNKSVDTNILVDSGATVVIGGVYTSDVAESEGGIPFLRDIPILGAFFGSKSKTNTKNELFIFLSPRIINEKEAGLRS